MSLADVTNIGFPMKFEAHELVLIHFFMKNGLTERLSSLLIKRIQEIRHFVDIENEYRGRTSSYILKCAICWSDTPEGHNFWWKVHEGDITDVTSICHEYKVK
jgi:hypothetical protein